MDAGLCAKSYAHQGSVMELISHTRLNMATTNNVPANPAWTSTGFQELLPAGIAASEFIGKLDGTLLLDQERKAMSNAVPRRIAEFTAGRLCARHALARFGVEDHAVVMQGDRRPLWPAHLIGSITHTNGYSAAAVGERAGFRGIGIDAEKVGRVTRDVWPEVLPREQAWLDQLDEEQQAQLAALIFSAKESFYKCQYDLTSQWLDFSDVTIDFAGWELGMGNFAVRPMEGKLVRLFEIYRKPVIGRFAFRRGLVLTAVTIG
jgi:4'-phosphopantetheinyl transferase EntD